MNKIKKTILTLVALLMTAATGAWAQGPVDGTIAWSVGNEASATVSASIKDAISSTGVTTGSGLDVSTGIYFDTNMVKYTPATANAGNVEGVMIEYTIEAVDGYKFKPTGVDYAAVKVGADNASYSWSYTIDGVESAITDVSYTSVLRNNGSNSGTAQLMHSESITADGCSVFTLRFYISNCGTTKNICIGNITISGSVSAAAASAVEVAWDNDKKTGTFDMPGGNVELEPEYYTQAAFAMSTDPTPVALAPAAIDNVPATTDGAIVNAGTVANIGTSEVKQGTVMYYVSQSTGETAPEAPDYDTDGWSEDVPTANGLAQGKAYVWYYIKGAEPAQVTDRTDDNTRSDSDIMPLGTTGFVTIAAEPTYNVEFAEGTNPEAPAEPEWTATPNTGVKKGETVTVTYTGSKKVIGVKVEKMAVVEGHALSASAVGEIVGSDGKAYAVADKDNLPSGVTAVAMVAYKSGSNGLAIQLNASPVEKNWADAKTYAEGLTAVPGGTWRLPSKVDWQNMFVGCAVSGDASAGDNMSPIAGFKAKIAATGITWLSADYWSSTESGEYAWIVGVNLNGSNPRAEFNQFNTSMQIQILGCLAF